MIVRVAVLGAVIDIPEDTKPEFRILVQNFAFPHVIAEMHIDEILVLQHILDDGANLLTPFNARVLFEDPVALPRKLLETVSHWISSSVLSRIGGHSAAET